LANDPCRDPIYGAHPIYRVGGRGDGPTGGSSEHPFEVDLDITGEHSLHRLLNTAVSQEGKSAAPHWLLNTVPDLPIIEHRQTLVRELTP